MSTVVGRRRHPRRRGQALVEFTLIFSLAIFVILAIIVGAYLFFQSEAVTNGARGGARWATIESSLDTGASHCESGSPDSIVNIVKKSTNIVPVNTAALCRVSTTELQQTTIDPTKANIVVDAYPSLAAPTCVTVAVMYKASALAVPFPTKLTLYAYSSTPVQASSSSTTTTTTTTGSSNLNCPSPGRPTGM